MKIFELSADIDTYNYLMSANEEDWDGEPFEGRSLAKEWIPFKVKCGRGKKYQLGDISSVACMHPVFNNKAIDVLKDFFVGGVELLPILYKEPYSMLNITNLIDALDMGKSEFERRKSGKIMFCTKYVFKEDAVQGVPIFKLTLFPRTHCLVGEDFVKCVQDNNLIGFEFEELWDSEA